MKNDPINPRTANTSRPTGISTDAKSIETPVPSPAQHRTWIEALAVIASAALAGLTIWILAVPIGGVSLAIIATGTTVGPGNIVVASALSGGAAWALLAALRRIDRGVRVWTIIGVGVLLASLAAPPLSGAAGAQLLVLELLHLGVGATVIIGLRLTVPPEPQQQDPLPASATDHNRGAQAGAGSAQAGARCHRASAHRAPLHRASPHRATAGCDDGPSTGSHE